MSLLWGSKCFHIVFSCKWLIHVTTVNKVWFFSLSYFYGVSGIPGSVALLVIKFHWNRNLNFNNQYLYQLVYFWCAENRFRYICLSGILIIFQYIKSKLTWLEECFFFFEFVWGRAIGRWQPDAESTININVEWFKRILSIKLHIAISWCSS